MRNRDGFSPSSIVHVSVRKLSARSVACLIAWTILISPIFARSSLAEEKAHGPTRALMSMVVILAFDQFRPAREPCLSEHRIRVADHDGCDTISVAAGFAERQQVVTVVRRERTCCGLQRHEPDHLPVGRMDRRKFRRPLDTRARDGSSFAERRAAQIQLPASP